MKATLEFTLPDEQYDFQTAVHAAEWRGVVWELDQRLRSILKYGEPLEDSRQALQDIRDLLWTELADRQLSLE